jgi:hypothetical protein
MGPEILECFLETKVQLNGMGEFLGAANLIANRLWDFPVASYNHPRSHRA